MSFDINFDGIDEDEFREAVADSVEERFLEKVEELVSEGYYECECGSTSFDVRTWKNARGDLEGAAVCRNCNERIPIELEADFDELR